MELFFKVMDHFHLVKDVTVKRTKQVGWWNELNNLVVLLIIYQLHPALPILSLFWSDSSVTKWIIPPPGNCQSVNCPSRPRCRQENKTKTKKKLMCVSVFHHFTTIPFLASGSGRLLILVPWLFRTFFFLSFFLRVRVQCLTVREEEEENCDVAEPNALTIAPVASSKRWWPGVGWGGMCVCNQKSPVVVVPLGKRTTFPFPKLLLFNRHKVVWNLFGYLLIIF
jgi:hypothetical protein